MATVYSERSINKIVSRIPGVKAEVADAALEIAAKAEAKLVRHSKTGDHKIEVEQGRVDSYVWLTGSAPLSVEFGHWVKGKFQTSTPKYVPGLYIITEAAGLI